MALPDVVVGSTGHVTHHNVLHNYTQFDRAVRYVETSAHGGSDSNDGLTPFEPKLTIQAAYDALPAAGGVVHVGEGRYDVGAYNSSGGANRLALDRQKPAHFIGQNYVRKFTTNGGDSTWTQGGTVLYRAAANYPANAGATDTYGLPKDPRIRCIVGFYGGYNGTTTDAVPTDGAGHFVIGNGFIFENLIFELQNPSNAGITVAICDYDVSHILVTNCSCWSQNPSGIFVYCDNSTNNDLDASWGRITECYSQGAALFYGAEIGVNCDSWRIDHNIGWIGGAGGGGVSLPAVIYMNGATRCSIEYNDLGQTGSTNWCIRLRGCIGCTVVGIAGESGGTKYLSLDTCPTRNAGSKSNYIQIHGDEDNSLTTGAVLVQIDDTCYSNFCVLPNLRSGSAGYPSGATPFIDNTTDKLNYVIGTDNPGDSSLGTTFWLPHLKRGAGTPEGAVLGSVGDLFERTDGGTTTTLYVKTSGANTNTGWTAK